MPQNVRQEIKAAGGGIVPGANLDPAVLEKIQKILESVETVTDKINKHVKVTKTSVKDIAAGVKEFDKYLSADTVSGFSQNIGKMVKQYDRLDKRLASISRNMDNINKTKVISPKVDFSDINALEGRIKAMFKLTAPTIGSGGAGVASAIRNAMRQVPATGAPARPQGPVPAAGGSGRVPPPTGAPPIPPMPGQPGGKQPKQPNQKAINTGNLALNKVIAKLQGSGKLSGVIGKGAAGTVGALAIGQITREIQPLLESFAKLRIETEKISTVNIFPGGPEKLNEMRYALGVTKEEAGAFFSVLTIGMNSGVISVDQMTEAGKRLREVYGGNQTAMLEKFVGLMKELPTLKSDLSITATVDDKAAAIFALAKNGKITLAMELEKAGVLSDTEIDGSSDAKMLNFLKSIHISIEKGQNWITKLVSVPIIGLGVILLRSVGILTTLSMSAFKILASVNTIKDIMKKQQVTQAGGGNALANGSGNPATGLTKKIKGSSGGPANWKDRGIGGVAAAGAGIVASVASDYFKKQKNMSGIMGDNKKAKRAAWGEIGARTAAGAATGAATGALLGPKGALIGGILTGLYTGLTSYREVMDELRKSQESTVMAELKEGLLLQRALEGLKAAANSSAYELYDLNKAVALATIGQLGRAGTSKGKNLDVLASEGIESINKKYKKLSSTVEAQIRINNKTLKGENLESAMQVAKDIQLKAVKELYDGMMAMVGNFDKIPSVVMNSLQSKIRDAQINFGLTSSTMSSGNVQALASQNVAASMENFNRAMYSANKQLNNLPALLKPLEKANFMDANSFDSIVSASLQGMGDGRKALEGENSTDEERIRGKESMQNSAEQGLLAILAKSAAIDKQIESTKDIGKQTELREVQKKDRDIAYQFQKTLKDSGMKEDDIQKIITQAGEIQNTVGGNGKIDVGMLQQTLTTKLTTEFLALGEAAFKALHDQISKLGFGALQQQMERQIKVLQASEPYMTGFGHGLTNMTETIARKEAIIKENLGAGSEQMRKDIAGYQDKVNVAKYQMDNAKSPEEKGLKAKELEAAQSQLNIASEGLAAFQAKQLSDQYNLYKEFANQVARTIKEDMMVQIESVAVNTASSLIELASASGDFNKMNKVTTSGIMASGREFDMTVAKIDEAIEKLKSNNNIDDTQKQLQIANLMQQKAQAEVKFKNDVVGLAKKEASEKQTLIDKQQGYLQNLQGFLSETGGNFAQIFAIQKKQLQLEGQSLKNSETQLRQLEAQYAAAGDDAVSRASLERSIYETKIEIANQEVNIQRKAMGMQRSAFDKLIANAFGAIRASRPGQKFATSDARLMGRSATRFKTASGLYGEKGDGITNTGRTGALLQAAGAGLKGNINPLLKPTEITAEWTETMGRAATKKGSLFTHDHNAEKLLMAILEAIKAGAGPGSPGVPGKGQPVVNPTIGVVRNNSALKPSAMPVKGNGGMPDLSHVNEDSVAKAVEEERNKARSKQQNVSKPFAWTIGQMAMGMDSDRKRQEKENAGFMGPTQIRGYGERNLPADISRSSSNPAHPSGLDAPAPQRITIQALLELDGKVIATKTLDVMKSAQGQQALVDQGVVKTN